MAKRRKRKESSRKHSTSSRWRSSTYSRKNPYLLWIVMGGLLLSLGGGYSLYQIMTKEGKVVATEIEVDEAFLEQLSDKVDRLWIKYNSDQVDLESDSSEALGDREALLKEIVSLQSELVKKTPDAVYGGALYDRLELFEAELNRIRAARLNRQLLPIEDAMAEAKKAKDKAREKFLLIQAIRIQTEINEIKEGKNFSNPIKLRSFKDRLETLEIGDRYEECLYVEKRADSYKLENRFEEAYDAYCYAVKIQLEIIQNFPESSYARVTRLDRLERKRDLAYVSQVMARIESNLTEVDHLEKEMKIPDALALMEKIFTDYQGLMDEYSYLLDDKEEFLAMLDRRKVQLTMLPKWAQLKDMEKALNACLRTGTFPEIKASLDEMLLILAEVDENSTSLTPSQKALRNRLRYMETMKDLIPMLRESVTRHLVVKDSFLYALYDAEVTQGLFHLIEERNPSATQGKNFPVESVSYVDVILFCKHLSWLLGRTVRLPYREEIEALKSLNQAYFQDPEYVWNARNSSMRIWPVRRKKMDASGVYDLWGNASEWLQKSSEGVYSILERNSMTPVDSDIFFREVEEGYRNRFLGFRFLVVWDDEDSL